MMYVILCIRLQINQIVKGFRESYSNKKDRFERNIPSRIKDGSQNKILQKFVFYYRRTFSAVEKEKSRKRFLLLGIVVLHNLVILA